MFVDEHEEAIESEETDDTTWFISNTDKIQMCDIMLLGWPPRLYESVMKSMSFLGSNM